ncbi:hypothetical [Yersinia pestis KIM10+]|uniref:Uncharacterized protein n=1 Tax=Yersinia pestis TaxID=632 RepID=Q8CKW6_YERPE|nr:hypothetical [Yersinia pestis KIM10+]
MHVKLSCFILFVNTDLLDGNRFIFCFICVERDQRRCISTTLIDSHDLRFTLVSNGLTKEAQRRCCIPFGSQQEIDGLACSVHCAVQIFPLVFNFDVGFVHSPSAHHGALMSTKGFIQQRNQTYNPAVRCSVEWSTITPRSAIVSSRFRRLRASARYQQTHCTMISTG